MKRFILCLLVLWASSYQPAAVEAKQTAKVQKPGPLRWANRQLKGLDHKMGDFYHDELEREEFVGELGDAILNYMMMCRRRSDLTTVFRKSCRDAHGGCEDRIRHFAQYIVNAADKYDLNPWMLAAMGYNESRFNPFAVGPNVGSKGAWQLHPRSKRGRTSKFVKSSWYRRKCKRIPGNCQEEIVHKAADHMVSSIRYCGNLAGGLSMYNTGRCAIRRRYIKNTARTWNDLQMKFGEKEVQWCDRLGRKNRKRNGSK